MSYDILFSPKKIGGITVKNRIVMPAMGAGLANQDGTVSPAMIEFYETRARGGAGLIITEVSMVTPNGRHNPWQIAAFSDRHIDGLRELADHIHRYGTKIFLQLYHPGAQTFNDLFGGPLLTPSGVPRASLPPQECRAMTVEEIHALVTAFAEAAARVKAAGIDGVEIHAAHGYLLNQFLSPYSNRRTDEYGGDYIGRCRILREIVVAIRERVGRDFPVTLRVSADEFMEMTSLPGPGIRLEDTLQTLPYLVPFGFDAVSVSSGTYDTQNVAWEPTSYAQGWRLYLAEAVRKVVDVPLIAVSVIREPDFAEQVLQSGITDFVGIARGQLADPEWGNKARTGRTDEIRRCISCLHCMEQLAFHNHTECAINASSHHEHAYGPLTRDGNGRRVVVLGAGPAGMEAARVLAERGFSVVLYEKSERLGGQLHYAAKPPFKGKLLWLIAYFEKQLSQLNVEVHCNTPASAELIRQEDPYAVFLSTGSNPVVPRSIPGVTQENVYTPIQILSGEVNLDHQRVVVVGSGMTGLETADLLCTQGNQVTVIEMQSALGPDLYFQNLDDVMGRLNQHHAVCLASHRLAAIEPDAVIAENLLEHEKSVRLPADSVVLSMGVRPDPVLRSEILEAFPHAILIGDAKSPGRIANAIHTAYLCASNLV